MLKRLSLVSMLCALSGCAGTQLAQNTLDVTSSTGELMKQQALRNIARQIVDPAMIPEQIEITLGSIQTSYQVTPSVSDPFSAAVTATTALVKTAAGAVTQSTDTNTKLANSKTVGSSAQAAMQQSWQVIPQTNTRALISFSLLYAYVVGQVDDATFTKEFPVVRPNLVTDDALRCVICLTPKSKARHISKRLVEARNTLFWQSTVTRSKSPPASAVSLGTYAGVTLYTTKPTAMRDFVYIAQDIVNGDDDPVGASGGNAGHQSRNKVLLGVTPAGEATTVAAPGRKK